MFCIRQLSKVSPEKRKTSKLRLTFILIIVLREFPGFREKGMQGEPRVAFFELKDRSEIPGRPRWAVSGTDY